MYVDDAVYGPALCKRLFPTTGSTRTSAIVKEWLCTDEGKSYLDNPNCNGQVIKVKCSRNRELSIDYTISPWLLMLDDPRVQDPLTKQGKLFRRGFHILCSKGL